MTVQTATRSTRSASPAKRPSLADIVGKGNGLPGRHIIHGVEGVGKTSLAANMPAPVFIQTRGETGLETLIDSGRLPEVPHWPECQDWDELRGAIVELTEHDHSYKTLVIDTVNGAERLCHEHVCRRDYGGDWGERGFTGYMRGFEVSLGDWREFLTLLDRLRETRRMGIVGLCHTKVKNFRNPEGPDYDRYQPDMHDKTWSLTHKWADTVLFLNFETFVSNDKDPKKKGKATGSQTRLLYTERHAAYDAKNRHGLPGEIELGGSGADAWSNLKAALAAGRNDGGAK
jgi:hypothetical protein